MLKKIPKILIYFFLIVFILQLVSLLFLLLIPAPSQAEPGPVTFTPQITIDETFQAGKPYTIPASTKAIGEYVRAIYKYAIGIVGILAAVVLMFGGILWLTAGGSTERVSSAKAWIGASLTGLILALCSYMILATINPALVDFRITPVPKIPKAEESTGGCRSNEYLITYSPDSTKGALFQCTEKCGVGNDSDKVKLRGPISEELTTAGTVKNYCCLCASGYCKMSDNECIPVVDKINDCKNKGGRAFCKYENCEEKDCTFFAQ